MKKTILLILCLIAVLFFEVSAGRNFAIIGSSAAPVKYIRGTGSNVGLYAGIELQPGAITYQNAALSKTGAFARPVPLGYRRGGSYIPGGGAQGMGKKTVLTPRPIVQNVISGTRRLSRFTPSQSLSYVLAKKTAHSEAASFQLLPLMWTILPKETPPTFELLLPVLCQDQIADPPDTNVTVDYLTEDLDTNSLKTYIGIYRIDQYLNDKLSGKIASNGNSFLFDPTEVSGIDLILIANSNVIVDSASQEPEYPEFYRVKHLFIEPQRANFALWAARGKQDEDACKAGLDHILETNNAPPASDSAAIQLYYFNHIVFAFAQMSTFQEKFRAPEGTLPPPPDLRPYAIIEWSPDSADAYNQSGGIPFSSTNSFDADGSIALRKWDFGDGETSQDSIPLHIYSKNGTYTVLLTITDNAGNKNDDSIQIKISAAGVVKNSGERTYNGINAYRAGKSIIVNGNLSNRNSRFTIESYNVKGQRTFSTVLQPASSNAHVDLSASMIRRLPHFSIWRLKDGASSTTKKILLLGE